MAGASNPVLAAAVSNAGGLGSEGLGEATPQRAAEVIEAIRARTNAAFNINLFVNPGAPPLVGDKLRTWRDALTPHYRATGLGDVPAADRGAPVTPSAEMIEVLLQLRPPVVSFHFGLPEAAIVARLKAAGTVIISTATTVAEAIALEAGGVDGIIAQGWEAGGHRGSHRPTKPGDGVGTLALVPQVVDAVRVPVIAAGGICDGRGIAAAMALGAAGVQLGTAFLRCPEASTEPAHRALLETATEIDTMVTDAISGRAARAVRSGFTEAMAGRDVAKPAFPALYDFTWPLVETGEASFHLYGQAAPLARTLPAAELVETLAQEALERMGALSGGRG